MLSALVPAVTFRGRNGNRAVACFVGAEALRDGASILVSSGPDEGGSSVVFVGASACVAPDGTVDRTNPQ